MQYYLSLLVLLIAACQPVESNRGEVPDTTDTPDTVQTVVSALHSLPPVDTLPPIDYDTTAWTELIRLDSTFVLDIRYATDSNFVGEAMYDCGRCFLRPRVAKALAAAQGDLRPQGYRIKLYDCYRPRPIQYKLWEKVPDPRYVANPDRGSAHNRGAAVDLTLVDSLGQELDMGTPFDFFGERAYPGFRDLPEAVLRNRDLLSTTLQAHRFLPIRTEWWHFNYNMKRPELSDFVWNCAP